MVASGFDPCMFVGEHVIAIVFVDGILFWATDVAYIIQQPRRTAQKTGITLGGRE